MEPQRELEEGRAKGSPHQRLSPSGHLTVPGDIVGCHNLGAHLPSSRQRPGVLPSVQRCTGQPLQQRLLHPPQCHQRGGRESLTGRWENVKRIPQKRIPYFTVTSETPEANCTRRFTVPNFLHNHSRSSPPPQMAIIIIPILPIN